MLDFRRSLPIVTALVAGLVAAACDRDRPVPRPDTPVARVETPAESVAAPVSMRGWREGAGRFLVVADTLPEAAAVVLPEFTDQMLAEGAPTGAPVAGTSVELFARTGRVGTATLAAPPGAAGDSSGAGAAVDRECTHWPVVRLASGAPPAGWTVALQQGVAQPIPLDSIEAFARTDSARAAADVARIASTLPGDTAAAFRGIPFAVHSLWRFRIPAQPGGADSVDVIVAKVVRRLGQEASPREEHLLIVAERPAGGAGESYRAAYVDRTSGPEEEVRTTEVLAALAVGPERVPTLVVSRDTNDGSVYVMLERGADGGGGGRWRVRWESAYAGC